MTRFQCEMIKRFKLSVREAEVLQLAALGKYNKDIAVELNVHPQTIKYHLRKIYRALGVKTKRELPPFLLDGHF